ncbi:MAG: WecB/TagA/CpsF family glycosyltransferase [Solirubrobacterales bacterium]
MTAPVMSPRQHPVSQIRTRRILGVDLAMTDYHGAMDYMDGMVDRGQTGYVCAVAVHGVMVAQNDREMARALGGASLIVPDGMPLVWASNMLGEGLDDRVYGPQLMARYCQRSVERGHRLWLYGGRSQRALGELARSLQIRYPGIQIVGGHAPPFRVLTPAEEQGMADRINADRPDVVWCGIGVPKQEKWMARMRGLVEAPVMVGVGAAFDFMAGRVSQAPTWMQNRGLEWTYRIVQEPGRLLPRYLYYNPKFLAEFVRQYGREGGRASRVPLGED